MQLQQHPNFKINYLSTEDTKEVEVFLKSFFNSSKTIQLKTSGSTGTPKIISVKKEFMINSAKASGSFFGLGVGTKALLCMNPNFIGGKMMLVRAMILGWELDVVDPSSNPLKNLNTSYDFCAMVPLQVSNSLLELHKIKKLIIGGGVVSNQLLENLQGFSTECFATYGMTETVSHIAVKQLNNIGHAELVSASHYKCLPDISISKDNRGCLVIDAPKISENKVITNDVVEIKSPNSFKWLGRYDNVINSGGVKLHPEVIAKKLEQLIEQPFFVAGIPDTILGEKLVLIIEGEINKNVILNRVKNLPTLSKYEVPKEVFSVPYFIKTETKKIQRNKTLDLINL